MSVSESNRATVTQASEGGPVSGEDGYSRFHDYFARPPLLTLEWHDPESPAVGVLVINSLRGGAAGGGTRMRSFSPSGDLGSFDLQAVRAEALFLAKTMEIKFRVSGPPIGGAKSVLHFDPRDPRKRQVLARWFRAIGPYLKLCYGTGGDLNVDEILEVIPLTQEVVGIAHPQEGVVAGHLGGADAARILDNLRRGVTVPVLLPDLEEVDLKLADLVTGFGVAESVATYFAEIGDDVAGKRVLVEGFGAVGGPSAYDFHRLGARVVGILCKEGPDFLWAVDPEGVDVPDLMRRRRPGALLPADCPRGPSPEAFWNTAADVFVPAARSQSIDAATLDRLREAGVSVIACGANNPFADDPFGDLAVQRRADAELAVLPDFIANCGMARTFAYLMSPQADLAPEAILADARATIRGAVRRILGGAGDVRSGLIGRALATFVP